MWSAESIAAVKVAAVICNTHDLKREVLCAPGSEYSRKVKDFEGTFGVERAIGKCCAEWNRIIETRTVGILEYLRVPEVLHEKIIGFVLCTGKQMLIWARHHERIIETSREFSIDILNVSFITQQGMVENIKLAEYLMNDGNLNITQKYKLATRYCLTDYIPVLYRQISENEREILSERTIRELSVTRFWTCYLRGDFYKLSRRVHWRRARVVHRTLESYVLELAAEDGSLPTIQKFFEQIILRCRNDKLVKAAVNAVKALAYDWTNEDSLFSSRIPKNRWIPNNYYIDILCFLLSKMTEDQQKEFLQKDIVGTATILSRILKYFLNSPYQNYFLKTAERMWQFLPENEFAALLVLIVQNIEQMPEMFAYGEGRCFDYRKLLREFWLLSPERFKTFVWCNEAAAATKLLIALLGLDKFTSEDREVCQLILASADKKMFRRCTEWIQFCCSLIRKERWDTLNRIVFVCFSSKEEIKTFRRHLNSAPETKSIWWDFLQNGRYGALESLMQWCDFTEEERLEWKTKLSFSVSKSLAERFIHDLDLKAVIEFLKWSSLPEEEARKLERDILCHDGGVLAFRELCLSRSLESARGFCERHLTPEETMVLKIRLMSKEFLDEIEVDEVQLEVLKFCRLSEKEIKELRRRRRRKKIVWMMKFAKRIF